MGKNIIVLGGLAVIGVIILIISFSGDQKEANSPAIPVNTETPSAPVVAATKNSLTWGNLGPGSYPQTVAPKSSRTKSLSIGGQGQAVLKITTRDLKIKVELKNEDHQLVTNSSTVKQTIIKQPNGETAFIFEIKSMPTAGVKNWQVIVNNPNPNTPIDYNLTVSETPPISADSTTGNETDGQANLSLTLEETVALNVTVPVIDATVVATITDPNGQTTTITLTEDPNVPGTYTGTFDDVDTPGIYQITYIITGENSEGEPFDQVVTDQFTVPDPNTNNTPTDPNPTYQSTKKFDINQADEIRPVY
jgi:hypothetical protein